MADETQIKDRIETLVAEEHELQAAGATEEGLTPEQHQRLGEIKVELDRYWDLLRQRRAHKEFGLDPENTSIRDAGTVEGYES
jgi:hypothetical protein